MKKTCKVALALFLGILFFAPNVFAYPVLGYVDPASGSAYSLATTTSGTATYSFRIGDISPYTLGGINVSFEDDVFDPANTYVIPGSQPSGWTLSFGPSFGGLHIASTSDPSNIGIASNHALSFQVHFKLLQDALTLDSLGAWSEGGPWQQGWAPTYIDAQGNNISGSIGGSTAPVPEPATMLLFGISLITVAGYGRYRIKRNKK